MGIFESQKYLIHFDTTDIKFPNQCPICGAPVTTTSSVMATMKDWTRSQPIHWRRSLPGKVTVTKHIEIPVCENHYFNFEDYMKIRGIGSILIGILMTFFIFITAIIFFHSVDFIILPPLWYLSFFGLGSLIAIGYRAIGPSQLERYVGIAEMSVGSQAVVLKFKNREYAKRVLSLNKSIARPLRVVKQGDSNH